ncbi:MAG: hypothetical protein Q7K57_57350 [Burkholderiaceae bacterium]|nr:hypothetical protein [Burkholderiaceae bacterium]
MKFEFIADARSFAQAMSQFTQRFARESTLHLYIIDHGITVLAILREGQRREMLFIDMPTDFRPTRTNSKKGLRL